MPWSVGPAVMRRVGRNYLVASLTALVLAVAIVVVRETLGLPDTFWTKLVPLALGMLPVCVFMPICWWSLRSIRRDFYAADGRLCTFCAYTLSTPAESGACPECGERYDRATDLERWATAGLKVPRDPSTPDETVGTDTRSIATGDSTIQSPEG